MISLCLVIAIPIFWQQMSRRRRTAADEPFQLIRSSSSNARNGEAIESHAHEWHQLIYVSQGVISVWTDLGSWVAPPRWAVWVPAGVQHGVRFIGGCKFRTLYMRPEWQPSIPQQCGVVGVSGLLHELILRVTEISMLDSRDPQEAAMATIAIGELQYMNVPPFSLPYPTSEATKRAVAIINDRGQKTVTTETLAKAVGLSPRSLERSFAAETGMSLGRWRQHQRLLKALERIALGQSIKVVAAAVGYATPSAFVAAFRSMFQSTPGQYFSMGEPHEHSDQRPKALSE
jgi:AraC-like DNA-binding protein